MNFILAFLSYTLLAVAVITVCTMLGFITYELIQCMRGK